MNLLLDVESKFNKFLFTGGNFVKSTHLMSLRILAFKKVSEFIWMKFCILFVNI